tara:strand:- start:971 stop:2869 length:1899 start_codon:yes stop_codon:yes gene_type:complete
MTDISFNRSDRPYKIFTHNLIYDNTLFNESYANSNLNNELQIINKTGDISFITPSDKAVKINNLEVNTINIDTVATNVKDISFDNVSIQKSLSIGDHTVLTVDKETIDICNLNVNDSLDVSGVTTTKSLQVLDRVIDEITFQGDAVFNNDVKFTKEVIFTKAINKSVNFDETTINFISSNIDFSGCTFSNIDTGNFNIRDISNILTGGKISNTKIGYTHNNNIDPSDSVFNNIALLENNNKSITQQSSSAVITAPSEIDNINKVLMIDQLQSYYNNNNDFENLNDIKLKEKFVLQSKNDQIRIKLANNHDICYNLDNSIVIKFSKELTETQISSMENNDKLTIEYDNNDKQEFTFYNIIDIDIIDIFNDSWLPNNLSPVIEFKINYFDNSGQYIQYSTNNFQDSNFIEIVKVYSTKWVDNTTDTLYVKSQDNSYNQSYSILMPRNRCKKDNILKVSDLQKYDPHKIYSNSDKIIVDSKSDNVVIVLPKILPPSLDTLIYPDDVRGTGLFIIEFDTSLNTSQYTNLIDNSFNNNMIKEVVTGNIDISKTFICGDINSPPFKYDSSMNSYQNDTNKFKLFTLGEEDNLPAVNKFSIFMRKKEHGFKPIFIESDKPDTCNYIDIIRNYNTTWGQQ